MNGMMYHFVQYFEDAAVMPLLGLEFLRMKRLLKHLRAL